MVLKKSEIVLNFVSARKTFHWDCRLVKVLVSLKSYAVLDFQTNQNGLNDHIGKRNKIGTTISKGIFMQPPHRLH